MQQKHVLSKETESLQLKHGDSEHIPEVGLRGDKIVVTTLGKLASKRRLHLTHVNF